MNIEPTPLDAIQEAVIRHPFLDGMSLEHLDLLASHCERLRFDKGDLIFKQGDPARHFYLIEIGLVVLTHAGLKHNVHIMTLEPGEALGWSWLFPPYAWHFNATAMDPSNVLRFDGERLRALCREQPGFGMELMSRVARVVIDRLQKTRKKYLTLAGEL